MAPLEGGPPNTVGVTNLIVFIDMATLGGRPADPHWGDQFAHFHQDNGPGGELCGPHTNDQFASFRWTEAIGRAPHGPRRDV